MAEEQQQDSKNITCQQTDDFMDEKIQTCDLDTPEDHGLDGKQPGSEDFMDEKIQTCDLDTPENHGLDGKQPGSEGKTSPPRDEDTANMEDDSHCQADGENRGDCDGESEKVEEPVVTADRGCGDHTKDPKTPGTTFPQVPDDGKGEHVDGPTALPDEESSAADNTNTEAEEDVASFSREEKDVQSSAASPQMPFLQGTSVVEESDVRRRDVETIRPTTTDSTEPVDATGIPGGSAWYLIAVGIVILIAVLVQHHLQQEPPPQKNDLQRIDIFLKQMEEIKTQFPNQRAELWSRSKIHLKRHLQTIQPTEPVSLILTAGLKAETTLHCLAQSLASAFSSALNASVLHIDGASTASQDSDQVKLDIDSKLQGAFEGDKPVAVIHRFEELPPGSTLIFYRYCDHENAAYKKTFLIFTVLLGDEDEIPEKINLSAVEEMVDDHLQKRFLSHDYPVSFDRMDLDKYGGLWSRISHLILPVAVEARMELKGC
ncbi:torsin-1A-interacting protein 2-like [Cololabis saira]|uniref:torsin-1A-interacting protein 2-like n=1 Tax=Cololabis saira TaxID=129043 RepID=UPI002AD30496|nr:torsin-1A-interacting protein 2-like [Cololabis saira]